MPAAVDAGVASSPEPNHSCGHDVKMVPATRSVSIPQDYAYHPNVWSNLSSKVWRSERTKEIVLEWDEAILGHQKEDERLAEIATFAIQKTQHWFAKEETTSSMFRILDLSSSMRSFMDHCRSNLTNIRSYKLKLTAMHGSNATRCPLWHADNVPLRWIQSYTGPGCVFLNEDETNDVYDPYNYDPYLQRVRETNHDQEAKVYGPKWKQKLVEMSGIPISQSPTGEPAMLVGRMWSAWSQQRDAPIEGPMSGVLHRSPHDVPGNQERILLNLDVLCAYDYDENEAGEEKGGHHHDHDHSNCDCACQQKPPTANRSVTDQENWKFGRQ